MAIRPQAPKSPGCPCGRRRTSTSRSARTGKLRKRAVGLGGVLFMAMAGSAPISAML